MKSSSVRVSPPGRIGPIRSSPPGEKRRDPCLFGLAPCGVYPAAVITARAVRSYRTFSPLPQAAYGFTEVNHQLEAVHSLLHLPSSRLEATVPDVIRHTALRSSDFPPPLNARRPERQRSSSRLHPKCIPLEEQNPREFRTNHKASLAPNTVRLILSTVPTEGHRMEFKEAIKIALQSLWANKLRS